VKPVPRVCSECGGTDHAKYRINVHLNYVFSTFVNTVLFIPLQSICDSIDPLCLFAHLINISRRLDSLIASAASGVERIMIKEIEVDKYQYATQLSQALSCGGQMYKVISSAALFILVDLNRSSWPLQRSSDFVGSNSDPLR
jgi:hypothetical protein